MPPLLVFLPLNNIIDLGYVKKNVSETAGIVQLYHFKNVVVLSIAALFLPFGGRSKSVVGEYLLISATVSHIFIDTEYNKCQLQREL